MFAGRPWLVKSRAKAGATTNAWSDLPENVWTDAAGLHLAISQRAQRWYSAEVTLNESLGYGTYSFRTLGRLDQLDPNAVLGLFTYDYADAAASYREMDIEYGLRLGRTAGANGHFAVHPTSRPGSTRDFFAGPDTDVWHHMQWSAQRVIFTSGGETFSVTGAGVPAPGRENVRMNLWLYNGDAPATSSGVSMVITDFRFSR
jgi:hypothetical protein